MQAASIPYQIRSTLLQLEPSLDADWEDRLAQIFNDVEPALLEEVDRHLLKPKDIIWHRAKNTFDYKTPESLYHFSRSLRNERMRSIARTLDTSLMSLKDVKDSLQIADFLENALDQIAHIPVEENVVLQREKLQIHRLFLLNAAQIIRELDLEIPNGQRHLTVAQIKSFIIEVFIKQQLLGYWFKPLLQKQAEEMKQPIFRYYLLKQQKIRNFHLVKTADFIFVVAPVMRPDQNPYSIRRFLIEEQGAVADQVFLNILVLDMQQAAELEYIEAFKELMERMVSVRSQIHLDVMDIVYRLQQICEQSLVPLLIEPIQFVEKNADVVAKMHLKKFENVLNNEFFKTIHQAVKLHLSHVEEFEYLYLNVHRLYSELLAYYHEFKSQPALLFNQYVQQFEYRLLGYLKLLEKRQDHIFVPLNDAEWAVMHERAMKPLQDIYDVMSDHLQDYRDLTIAANRVKREATQKVSFFQRMTKGVNAGQDLNELQKNLAQLKHKIFTQVVQIPKQNNKCSVALEFESMHIFSETDRHFAFPCGDNGLTRLPVLLRLPEQYTEFDVEDFNATIHFDLNFSVSSKTEQAPSYDFKSTL